MALDERRKNRIRKIRNRFKIITNCWHGGSKPDVEKYPWPGEKMGKLAKYNLVCGCEMCRKGDHLSCRDKKVMRREGKKIIDEQLLEL